MKLSKMILGVTAAAGLVAGVVTAVVPTTASADPFKSAANQKNVDSGIAAFAASVGATVLSFPFNVAEKLNGGSPDWVPTMPTGGRN